MTHTHGLGAICTRQGSAVLILNPSHGRFLVCPPASLCLSLGQTACRSFCLRWLPACFHLSVSPSLSTYHFSLCLSVQLLFCPDVHLPVSLTACLPACHTIRQFFFFCLSVFLFSACLSVSGSIFASQLVFFACLSVTLLSTCPPIDLLPSVFPSFYLPFCPLVSVSLNVCLLYASLLVLLSICLSVCLSLFAYPPVYLSARLSPTVPASPTVCLSACRTDRTLVCPLVCHSFLLSFSLLLKYVCPRVPDCLFVCLSRRPPARLSLCPSV